MSARLHSVMTGVFDLAWIFKTMGFCKIVNLGYIVHASHTIWFVLAMVCACFGLCLLWFVLAMVCDCYGLCLLWFVLAMVCACFGLCLLWFVLALVCDCYG